MNYESWSPVYNTDPSKVAVARPAPRGDEPPLQHRPPRLEAHRELVRVVLPVEQLEQLRRVPRPAHAQLRRRRGPHGARARRGERGGLEHGRRRRPDGRDERVPPRLGRPLLVHGEGEEWGVVLLLEVDPGRARA